MYPDTSLIRTGLPEVYVSPDVVRAYRGTIKEKEALEASLNALSQTGGGEGQGGREGGEGMEGEEGKKGEGEGLSEAGGEGEREREDGETEPETEESDRDVPLTTEKKVLSY